MRIMETVSYLRVPIDTFVIIYRNNIGSLREHSFSCFILLNIPHFHDYIECLNYCNCVKIQILIKVAQM